MKKTISFILFIVMLILLFDSGTVYAATPTFTMTCEIDKVYGVAQTKEVTVYFGVKDFRNFENSITKGINVLQGVLVFDENVFEPITINLTDEGYYAGIATKTYKGKAAMVTQNSWSSLVYNPETRKFVIENSNYINTDMGVLAVTFKVKANAPIGNTTITLKDVIASDRKQDIYPQNKDINVSIETTEGTSGTINGKYIRILPDTTVKDFKALHTTLNVVKNSAGTTLVDTDLVPTGATTADSEHEYTIIAVGDLNSDGKLTATDLSQLKSYSVGLFKTLNDNQKRAADIKWDAKFSAVDLSQMKMLMIDLGDPRIAVWYGSGDKDCVAV